MSLFSELLVNALGIATALLAIILAYYKWSFQYWKRRNVPSLEPSIPFGNLMNPFKRTVSLGEEIQQLFEEAKKKGLKHCGVYNMTVPTYLIMDLEVARLILTKDFSSFSDRGLYWNEKEDPITVHIFTIGNPKWKNLRSKLTPTFTSGKLKTTFHILTTSGSNLENFLGNKIESSTAPVDIKDALARFTVDNIGSFALGMDCNSFEVPNEIRKKGEKFFFQGKFQSLKSTFNWNFPNLARFLGFRDIPKNVSDFFMEIVKDVVSHREKHNLIRRDYLQILIDLKNKEKTLQEELKGDDKVLTMNEIVAQSFAIVLAGYETSANTMTFAMYELALHPEIQEKLREEIRTVLAKYDNQITYEALSEMKYMAQVVDETLRKYPGAPFLIRQSTADYKIPGEDITLEAGTRIIFPVLGHHHDEDHYPNPEKFDPERFNAENKKNRHPYAYTPFGIGPRQCLGERFGLLQVQVGLVSILRSFKVTLHPKTDVPMKFIPNGLLLGSQNPVWMNISKV